MAAVRNWAAMEGYRIEQDDESEMYFRADPYRFFASIGKRVVLYEISQVKTDCIMSNSTVPPGHCIVLWFHAAMCGTGSQRRVDHRWLGAGAGLHTLQFRVPSHRRGHAVLHSKL